MKNTIKDIITMMRAIVYLLSIPYIWIYLIGSAGTATLLGIWFGFEDEDIDSIWDECSERHERIANIILGK